MPLHTLEHSIQQIIDQEIKIGKIDSEPVLSNEHDKYWYLLRRFREQSRLARMVCGSAYALGILGIVWVLLENAFFVFRFVFF